MGGVDLTPLSPGFTPINFKSQLIYMYHLTFKGESAEALDNKLG